MALSCLFIQPSAYAHPNSIQNKCLVVIKLDKNIKTLDNNPHYRLLISKKNCAVQVTLAQLNAGLNVLELWKITKFYEGNF